MPQLEANIHIVSLIMDPFGLHERRQNQGLHRTIQIFPLGIDLRQVSDASYREEAFTLAVPHIGRFRTLSVSRSLTKVLPVLIKQFFCPIPLLSKPNIDLVCNRDTALPGNLFNGDLSSLRELPLAGVITPLPWRGLSNLTTFELCHIDKNSIFLTRLLDFFESTPQLRYIQLRDSIPISSTAPTKRVVRLPHLKELGVFAQPAHPILLNHLSIPAGASLRLGFTFSGNESPIPFHLPKSFNNRHNISHIATINLRFGSEQKFVRLNGPSGELYILGSWVRGSNQPHAGANRFLWSLDRFDI